MKKLVSAILAVALVLSLCTVMSFAAEDYVVDLSTVEFTGGSGGEHAPHGYAGVDTLLLGYGNVVTLGNMDLGDYSACEITYATDLGYVAQKEDMKIPANFSLKSNNVCIGCASQDPQTDGLLAQADCIDVDKENLHNPDGTNWDKDERVCSIDLTNVDYSGEVWLSHFNSTGNEALVAEIKFVAKEAAAPAGLINDADYSVSYVIDKTNATSWAGGQIGDLSVTYFFNVKDDGLEVAVRAIGLVQDNLVQLNFNPGNKLWDTTGQFVSFKLGDTLTVLQHNHKNGLLDDDSAGGADITAKVPNQIVKLDNGYEFTAKLPKELFTITDVEGADSFVYGQDDLYFGMFLVAGGGGLSNQQNTDYTDWTCKGLALNQYKFAGTPAPVTEPETVPQTGDAAVAMFAVIAVLAMGAAVVFMKKRAF